MTNVSDQNRDMFAIASLVLGVVTLCAWFIPICGCPLSIIGIILGVMGLEAPSQRTMAQIGLVLCVLTLLAAIGNGILGAAINLNG